MSTAGSSRRIAIVGSGFSGVAVAWQLLGGLPSGSRITLINGSGRFARGLAYGTQSADHLLNVPAGRMSLDPAQPEHFVQWLRAAGSPSAQGSEFVSRRRYGDYLQASLEARIASRPDVALDPRVTAVTDVTPHAGRWQLQFSDGSTDLFDAVVLAIGHLAPRPPHPGLVGLAGYAADPWAETALEGLAPDASLALIGSGLTMLDVLISLRARGHAGPVLALSRRGLLPQGHRRNEGPPQPWALDPAIAAGRPLREQLRRFRAELARAQAAGVDWRDVWAAFRADTPRAWRALDAWGRRQFLRHLLPYWDVHRHRAAPQARAVLEDDLASGRLRHAAGRLIGVDARADRLHLHWRARGRAEVETFSAARVINCSGPSSVIDAESSPLLWRLQQAGRLQPCPHGLGLLVDEQHQVRDAHGRGQAGLHYIGPHLRAQLWEATAVPELREHAAQLAAQLLRR